MVCAAFLWQTVYIYTSVNVFIIYWDGSHLDQGEPHKLLHDYTKYYEHFCANFKLNYKKSSISFLFLNRNFDRPIYQTLVNGLKGITLSFSSSLINMHHGIYNEYCFTSV